MGVKPVKYDKPSSTAGFANAGDEKAITKTNANTIQKDVKQGFVETLDNAQKNYLSEFVDEDNIKYSEDEQKNVGKSQINTDGTKNNTKKDIAGNLGQVGGAAVAAGAATIGGASFAGQLTGEMLDTNKLADIPFGAIGAGALAVTAASLVNMIANTHGYYSD